MAGIDTLVERLRKESNKKDYASKFTDSLHEGYDYIEVIYAYDPGSEWFNKDEAEWDDIPTKENEWEEAVEAYTERELKRLSRAFQKIEFQSKGVVAARCITLKNNDDFIEALNRGETIQGVKGMGIWWSWDKDKASCHGDAGGKNWITVEALIPFENIDYSSTLLHNTHPSLGEDEAEITVLKGKDVEVLSVKDKNYKLIWSGNQTVKASLKLNRTLIAALKKIVADAQTIPS